MFTFRSYTKKPLPIFRSNMVMDNYYVQDRLQALWHKIDTLHLCYLEMEESPQKLDQRTKLEGMVNNKCYTACVNQ